MIGVRTSKIKYYRSRTNPKENVHLFDLEKDPKEENNLANKKELVEKMEKILKDLLSSKGKINSKKLSDEEVKKGLEEIEKKLLEEEKEYFGDIWEAYITSR